MSGTMMPKMCPILVVTQCHNYIFETLKKNCTLFTGTAHHSSDATTGFAAVATRTRAGCWSMEGHTSLSTALESNNFTFEV